MKTCSILTELYKNTDYIRLIVNGVDDNCNQIILHNAPEDDMSSKQSSRSQDIELTISNK